MAARLLDRTGKGLRTTARDAMIADVSQPGQLGRSFGLHRAMDTTGALIGCLIAFAMLGVLPRQYRLILGFAVVPGVVAVVLTFLLRESMRDQQPPEQGPKPSATEAVVQRDRLPRLQKSYWHVLALLLLFALANSSDTFLLLRASNVGLGDSAVVLAYLVFQSAYVLTAYPAGALSDRIGRGRVIGTGWFLYAGVYAGFAATSPGAVWPLFAMYGVYMGMTHGVTKALIADHCPAERRGLAMGVFLTGQGFVMLLGSLTAGWLWDHVSPAAPFWFASAVAAMAWLLLCVFGRRIGSTQLTPDFPDETGR